MMVVTVVRPILLYAVRVATARTIGYVVIASVIALLSASRALASMLTVDGCLSDLSGILSCWPGQHLSERPEAEASAPEEEPLKAVARGTEARPLCSENVDARA